MLKFNKNIGVLVIYCLPAALACAMLSYSLYARSMEVSHEITRNVDSIRKGGKAQTAEMKASFSKDKDDRDAFKNLISILEREKAMGTLTKQFKSDAVLLKLIEIWASRSLLISGLALLPFFLLGSRLAFGEQGFSERRSKSRVARSDFVMKFLVAFTMAFGWTYTLLPSGRGAGLANEFISSIDILSSNTLPIYIHAKDLLAPTICGFLGWYLHLLGYFFQKFVLGDVYSTRVYGLLFRKFLLVWGIALMVSSLIEGPESKLVMFLIGFFPLTAFSLLKEVGAKSIQGTPAQKDSLNHLPALSRWHIIRLEEEGIDNVPALAASDPAALKAATSLRPSMIDLWIDAARLFSLVGVEKYQRLKSLCITATEFILRSRDTEFVKKLSDKCEIENAEEIERILRDSFNIQTVPEKELPVASDA